jgi:hypothetical protein
MINECKIINSSLDLSDHKTVMIETKWCVDPEQSMDVDDTNVEHSEPRRFPNAYYRNDFQMHTIDKFPTMFELETFILKTNTSLSGKLMRT